jgi:hypothetical protein
VGDSSVEGVDGRTFIGNLNRCDSRRLTPASGSRCAQLPRDFCNFVEFEAQALIRWFLERHLREITLFCRAPHDWM